MQLFWLHVLILNGEDHEVQAHSRLQTKKNSNFSFGYGAWEIISSRANCKEFEFRNFDRKSWAKTASSTSFIIKITKLTFIKLDVYHDYIKTTNSCFDIQIKMFYDAEYNKVSDCVFTAPNRYDKTQASWADDRFLHFLTWPWVWAGKLFICVIGTFFIS